MCLPFQPFWCFFWKPDQVAAHTFPHSTSSARFDSHGRLRGSPEPGDGRRAPRVQRGGGAEEETEREMLQGTWMFVLAGSYLFK